MINQQDCDEDCLSCNMDTYISCERRINPNTRPDSGQDPKFTKNCMCNKYTNCMDCQQHDNEIRNKALDDFMAAIEFRFDDTNRGRGVVGTIRGLRDQLKGDR